MATTYHQQVQSFYAALAGVSKSVKIEIAPDDLTSLKLNNYKMCFAKRVGDNDYNVVWQAYDLYLQNNMFSWVPLYELFGTNQYKANIQVTVHTNKVPIHLGETAVLNSSGILGAPKTGGSDLGFTLDNQYGSIHPGVNQLSVGIDGSQVSTPIYVAPNSIVMGQDFLQPVEKVLVWFEQNIQTSTIFSSARSNSIEIDLTNTNAATRLYKGQKWTTP